MKEIIRIQHFISLKNIYDQIKFETRSCLKTYGEITMTVRFRLKYLNMYLPRSYKEIYREILLFRLKYLNMYLPRSYKEIYREILLADANVVDLHKLGNRNFYLQIDRYSLLGCLLVCIQNTSKRLNESGQHFLGNSQDPRPQSS